MLLMMTRTVWVCKIEGSYILLLRGFILVSSRLLLQCWDVSIWLTFTLFFFVAAGWLAGVCFSDLYVYGHYSFCAMFDTFFVRISSCNEV